LTGEIGESPESPEFSVKKSRLLKEDFWHTSNDLQKGRRSFSFTSYSYSPESPVTGSTGTASRDPWGWFEDFEATQYGEPDLRNSFDFFDDKFSKYAKPLTKALSLPAPKTVPPLYILEASYETQQLWYSTAGRRPKQPESERKYFEKLWMQNFEASNASSGVDSQQPEIEDVLGESKDREIRRSCEMVNDFKVVWRGTSPFSNSVSKSFPDSQVCALNIQLPSFRICRSKTGKLHAEFLVVLSFGQGNMITYGVWKRHSDFAVLADDLRKQHNRLSPDDCDFGYKNTLLSWDCVMQRKKLFKCLDYDYLSLKCFLIERYMHDFLFECSDPTPVIKFLNFA
jgi:hypothetical protein